MNTHASMNRIYRLVWNDALGAFVPASELSSARGKRSSRCVRAGLCAALALIALDAAAAEPAPNALPTGGEVVRGAATLSESAGRLDIAQSTNRAVIDWQRFDIGRDATVNFAQPSSSSLTLNRVLSADPSAIFGRLTANGQVFLTNPNGVLFGSSARVDVGSLVATSMQIGVEDFLSGNYRFSGGAGAVTNYGTIDAAAGGYLALMAPEVRNEGVLSARLGTIALAAGQAATLQLDPGAPFAVQVDPATVDVLLENRHLIQAEGGQVILSASAAERLMEAAIPGASGATGLVAANGTTRLVNVEGEIRASQIAIDGGAVGVTRVAGSLDATVGDVGGSVLVTGDKVLIDAGAAIDASGRVGGAVLIGGDRQGANPDVRNAARVFVDTAAEVRADGGADAAHAGDAGRVIVYSRENSQVHGTLSARGGSNGGNGGFIETSGGWLDVTSVPDASAALGTGGEWLIDPYNITIQAAGSDTSIGSSPNWSSTGDSAILTTGSIQSALNAGTSVTVTTGGGGSQGGDIVVSSGITKSAGGSATLTMNAHRDIVIDAAITATTGALSLSLNADSDSDLAGAIVLNNNLTTLGGAINFLDGVVIGGNSALSINTAGGAGGNVSFSGQVLIGNTNGVTITTGGGNVTFASLLDSGNGYTFVNNPLTWLNARTAAASGTGAFVGNTYLATITSPLEMSRAAATANYSQSWLGGNDVSVEGTWRWVTGPEGLEDGGQGRIIMVGNRTSLPALTGYNGYNGGYVNWNAGEPNDYNGAEDALQLGFGAAGQWNDLPTNSSTLPYVMETNLASSPLTIDSGSGSVTFNGDVGANKAIGALTLSGSGNVYLNANTLNVSGNLTMNAGGDLVIGASNSPTLFADNGEIFMHRDIVKSAGADAALILRADGDIHIDSGADITSSSNRLDVTLNSDRDGDGGGILVDTGSIITSNGGNVVLGGGATPASVAAVGTATTFRRGVFLTGSQIISGAGNITINGRGENNGIATTDIGIGVDLVQATLETTSGAIAVNGTGSAGNKDTSLGISVFNNSLVRATAGGSVALTGTASGTGQYESGINIDIGSTIAALNGGSVALTGTGSSGGTGSANHGIFIQNSSSVLGTGSAAISLTGTGGAGSSGIATLTGSNVIGNSSGYTGNIMLTADTMALANLSVRSTGALTVRSLMTSTSIGLGDSASGTLNLTAAELAYFQDGFSSLTFGRSDGTGDIDMRAYTFVDALTLVSGASDGDITVNGDLRNTGGSIELEAGDAITVAASGDITTQGAALTLNSDRDASGAGNIVLSSGAVLTSNGGNITLRGGSAALGAVADPTSAAASFISTLNATGARGSSSAGISLQGASILAGGGNIDIRGVGSDGLDGINIGASSTVATTGSGSIAMHGLGGTNSDDSDGITQNSSSSSTESGELRMQGLGRGGSQSQGIDLSTLGATPTVSATDGNVVLRGVSTGNGNTDQGILIRSSAYVRTTGAGSIDAVGRGGGAQGGGQGIHVTTSAEVEVSGGGDISLTGYGSSTGTQANNEGVTVDAGLVEVLSGTDSDLSVIGYGGTGTNYNIGVNIRMGGTLRSYATAGGSITVSGTGGNGSGTGNWGTLAEDGIYESMGAASMLLTGIGGTGTDNYGIKSTGGSSNRIGSSTMTGALTLRADTMDLATAAVIVRGGGTLALEPYSSGTTIGIGDGATGTLNLNTTALGRLVDGFSQITIGRSDGTGAIDVEAATFSDNLHLLNASGGIDFDGAVSLGANRLWLTSAGAVTQSAAISANQLLLTGAGAVTLTNANNSIGTLAASMSSNLSLTNNGSLSVASITANGTTYDGIANAGGSVLLRAAGASADLTLQRAVTTTTAGTSLQLVAGRNFVNNFGVSALDAGVGRWLVWSANPANDVRGGLAYDFKQYAATYAVTSPAQSSGDGFMYSIAPTLTPTLTGSVTRTYDNSTDVTLSSANFSNTGSIDGDSVALTTSNPGVLDSKNVGTGKQVTASSISISGATNGAAAVYGYELAATGATGAIGEVTPRTVTAALIGSTTKVYDGTTAATLASNNYSLGGVLGADVVSLNNPTAGTYASANVGNSQLVTVTGLAISGAGASNYALAAGSASGSIGDITPKSLLVTAADASRIYGDANPQFTVGMSGFVTGEDTSVLGGSLSFNTPGVPTSNVGTYAIHASGLNAANYSLSYAPGTLTINPAALTIAASAASKTYGNTDPVLGYSVSGAGLRNGDVLTGSLSAPTGAAATAGTHQILQGTVAATSNYTVSFTPGTLTVLPAALVVTAADRGKVYGAADPVLGYAVGGDGLRYSDALTGSLFAPTGAAATAGLHQIAQGTLAASANYAVTYVPGTLSVAQAPLLVTADDQTKIYGDAEPTLTYSVGGNGLSYGDTLSGTLLAPVGAAATAGTHQIAQGSLAASSNYAMTFAPGTLSVSQAALVLTASDQVKVYGDAEPTLTYSVGGAGLRYADTLSGALFAPTGAAATAGTHSIGQGSLAASANYALTFVPGTLNVTRAPLIITADDHVRFVFNANPELSASGVGWRYGDGLSVVTGLQLSTAAAPDSVPGSYAIDASGASAANYSITYRSGALQVLPQSLLTGLPQGGEVVSHAGAQAAPPTARDVVALSNSVPAILSAIHNGGVATAGGSASAAAPTSTSAGFIAAEPLRTVDIGSSQQVQFSLPSGTFRHADTQAAITTTAMCADGSPLPASLSYDPRTGTLTGSLPEGMTDLAIVFVARDGMGGEATTTLVLHAEQ
jgi:filamentous hemagglutinin family protein